MGQVIVKGKTVQIF